MRDMTDEQIHQAYMTGYLAFDPERWGARIAHLEGLRAVIRADRQRHHEHARAAAPRPETAETQR